MNLTGRFDFWRVLLHSRSITPPRQRPDPLPGGAMQWRHAWWLLIPVVLAMGMVAVRQVVRVSPSPQAVVAPDPPPAPTAARSRAW